MNNNIKGFTLIEVLISIVILSIGLLGIVPLLISNIRLNEEISMRNGALKIIEGHSVSLRGINYDDFTVNNLITNFNFSTSYPNYFSNPTIGSNCPTGYESRLYKEDSINKIINGSSISYRYLIKLCIDEDFLYPYLKKAHLWVFWKYRNKFHKMETEIFIGKKT